MDDPADQADRSKRFSEDGNVPTDPEGIDEKMTGDRFATDRSATRLAFVLQFAESVEAEEFRGRVQNLVTSDGGNFSSPDALIAILRRVMAQARERSEE